MNLLYFLIALSLSPLAAEEIPSDGIDNPFGAHFMKMLFILSIMVGALIFLAWATKRLAQPRIERQNALSAIKIVEGRQLTHKSMVWLIEVEGKKILIGESHAGLVKFTEFEEKI